MKKLILIGCFLFSFHSHSQSCGDLNIQLKSEIVSTCDELPMTMLHDQLNAPVLELSIHTISVEKIPFTFLSKDKTSYSIQLENTSHSMYFININGSYTKKITL